MEFNLLVYWLTLLSFRLNQIVSVFYCLKVHDYKTLLSHSFCGLGVSGQNFCLGSHQAKIKLLSGVVIVPGFGNSLMNSMVVGRIYFLLIVGLRSLASIPANYSLKCGFLYSIEVHFSKTGRSL